MEFKFGKRGQEEMVGFILIVVLVAVILLFFLGFSLREKETSIDSNEAESFITAFLSQTTECKTRLKNISVQDLIFECSEGRFCLNEKQACNVLDTTLTNLTEKSWRISGESPIKGYELRIVYEDEEELFFLGEGVKSPTYKGSLQNFARAGESIDITFRVYV